MSAYRRGKTYYLDYVDETDVRRRPKTNAPTKAAAEALESELKLKVERIKLGLEVRDRNPKKWTMREAVEWWAKAVDAKGGNQPGAASMRKHVVGPFADLPLEQVTKGKVTAWLDEREAYPLAGSTVNNLRAYLSGVFTKLVRADLFVGDNPVRHTERREVEPSLPRALPASAIRALIDHAPTPGWKLVFMLALLAGLRRSDIKRLEWNNVDLALGVIYVKKPKVKKKPRLVPIHDELLAALKTAQADGTLVVGAATWNKSAAMVRSSLATAGIVIPAGIEVVFHSLRHTWATRLVECGAAADVVELIGWGPRASSVFQTRYLHLTVEKLRAEVNKLTWPAAGEVIQMAGHTPVTSTGGRSS